jgi:hypothetical protein
LEEVQDLDEMVTETLAVEAEDLEEVQDLDEMVILVKAKVLEEGRAERADLDEILIIKESKE